MAPADIRTYAASARSTDVLGRVLCSARNQHFVIDGPVQAGFPGEAVTPGEMFLAAISACGVELVQALARDQGLGLKSVACEISGAIDRSQPVRSDVSVLNAARLEFTLAGVTPEQGEDLIRRFKGR